MKIRIGFISNSSSSSFIVGLKGKPTSVEDLRKQMFPNGEEFIDSYLWLGEKNLSTQEIAERVFQDLLAVGSPASLEELGEYLSYSRCPELDNIPYPDYELFNEDREEYKRQQEAARAKTKEIGEELALKLILQAETGIDFYILTYSDNDGTFDAQLEHSDIFRNLPHERISNH